MSLFRWFRRAAAPASPYDGFTVEHYPETGRFYPTYRGSYIKRCHDTGIYEFKQPFLFMYADFGKSESDAWKIVDLVREQRLKQNVRVLTRSALPQEAEP